MTTAQASATQQIIDRHDQFMIINVGRNPIAMTHGQGAVLFDAEGREYLDLFAGFGGSILGHCHPDLVRAVSDQAGKLWHVGNLFHTEPQTRAAEAIARHGFGGRSFFCHSGADANEAAVKLARLYGKAHPGTAGAPSGGRFKIIAALGSFHGRTFGAMAATGQDKVRKGYEPLLPGFVHVPYNDLAAVRQAIDHQTVAIMVEPIQGEGGVVIPGDDYLPGLRALCDQQDLLLILDEVWTGCGRTGRYFAHQHWNVTPDIMTLAKGVGGGLAVGAMCATPRLAELFDPRVHHGVAHATTLGGNCLAMAVSAAIFEVIERDGLLEHAEQLGRRAVDRLQHFAQNHPAVKAVRGKGLFIGIEVNPTAPGAWFKNSAEVVHRAMERGLLINGTQETVIRLAPSLAITTEQLDRGLSVLESVLTG